VADHKNPATTPEPAPQPNTSRPIWELVIEDMRARDAGGREKYKTPLQAFNGRDADVDLYQELLDAVAYQRQKIEERRSPDHIFAAVAELTSMIHCQNVEAGWWTDPATGEWKDRNFGELIALCHSELSEALEGYRKDLMDDHLPHRKMPEVELADTMIRIFDLAAGFGYDLAGAMREKLEYNRHRADHKIEARLGKNGKKF
jgi:hypothetical protein